MNTKNTSRFIKPTIINRHLNVVYPALALLAGMELEIFTFLHPNRKSAEELAELMSVSASKLRPLLYALVTAGVLEVTEEKFSNSVEAEEFLVKGKPRYFGDSHRTYHDLWESTLLTAKSIRTGVPQAKHDFAGMSSEELENFIVGLDAGAAASARRLHKTYDFSRFESVLDAGGGSGGLAAELAKLCPKAKATIAELPSVAAIARRCVSGSGLDRRVSVIEADLTNSRGIGGTYDAIVLRSVIQVLSLEEADVVIRNTAAALSTSGEFFLIGRVLENNRVEPIEAVSANVMFLNVYDSGQAYTIEEYERLFEKHGLSLKDKQMLTGGYTMLQFLPE